MCLHIEVFPKKITPLYFIHLQELPYVTFNYILIIFRDQLRNGHLLGNISYNTKKAYNISSLYSNLDNNLDDLGPTSNQSASMYALV